MRNLKDAKDIYDHIVVPEELDGRLREALASASPQKPHKSKLILFSQWSAGAVAALLLIFTIGLNSNQSFAMEMSDLPFIGRIAKVLTIRSYETTSGNTTTTVQIPEVHLEGADTESVNAISDVNAKIQSLVDEFTEKKLLEVEEYKTAFLAAGGSEEDWEARSIDINVSYQIMYQDDHQLSLLVDSWISWFNFEEEWHFYNINLQTGEELTLLDFLGPDGYAYASDCVRQQMQQRMNEYPDTYTYWGFDESDDMVYEFAGVDENTLFYINESGNVVITYDKYEVAPGAMGIQEFIIPSR